jgi:ketosteroid isomerase-like protein
MASTIRITTIAPVRFCVRQFGSRGTISAWRDRLLAFGASMLVLGTACAATPPELKRDLEAGNQAWVVGLKTGNADLIAAAYVDDSINCGAAGECVKGREAAAAQYRDVIAKFGRATDAFVRSESLRVDHDLAYESGYAEAHFPNGLVRRGRFSTVWKVQSDGHWKIFRNLSLPAAPK